MTESSPGGEGRFENIGWTVGNYCNASCGHCYSWQVRKESRSFLSRQDVDRVIGQLVQLGVRTVNIGGNEPIYTHGPNISETILPYVLRRLTDAGILVGLTTNGVSFSILDTLYPAERALLNDVDFSLDSPFADEHDLNRGTPLFGSVLSGIQRCRELGLDAAIITCGLRLNFNPQDLSGFLALARHLGCELRVNTLKPMSRSQIGDMPTPEQYFEGFAYLMQNSRPVVLAESCLSAFTEAGHPGCPCGLWSFRINGLTRDGRLPISPCVYTHDFQAGDLLTQDLGEILESPEFRAFGARQKHLPAACRDIGCPWTERCRGGCAARAWLVHGSLDARDPYCPLDHVRNGGKPPGLPPNPRTGSTHGVRVHDRYLCTWIGEVSPDFSDPRTVEDFLKPLDHPPRRLSQARRHE